MIDLTMDPNDDPFSGILLTAPASPEIGMRVFVPKEADDSFGGLKDVFLVMTEEGWSRGPSWRQQGVRPEKRICVHARGGRPLESPVMVSANDLRVGDELCHRQFLRQSHDPVEKPRPIVDIRRR